MSKEILIIADYSEQPLLDINELCEICAVTPEFVSQVIAYEIILPVSSNTEFDLTQLKRLQAAIRLQRDLDLNLAGVAMVLDLLDELEQLRQQRALLHKHLHGG